MIIINNKYPLERVRYTLLAIMLAVSTNLCAMVDGAGFNFINDKTSTVIPFEIVNNLIVIPVVINEGISVNLVLDTGVRSIVLFGRRFKKELEIYPKRTVPLTGYGKRNSHVAKLSLNNNVKVADIEGKGLGILITPNNKLFSHEKGVEIEGLIGYQIFSRFAVVIDYVNKRIEISEPSPDLRYQGFEELPLIIKDTKPYISANLKMPNNEIRQAHLHVDTGSARELILFMKEGVLELPKTGYDKSYIGHGLRGAIDGFVLESTNVEMGKSTFENSNTCMIEREFSDRELSDAMGTLGSGFFKDFFIVLDYPNQKFYFKKGKKGDDLKYYVKVSKKVDYLADLALCCNQHLEH
ncbi:MAG: aspartyl protease family protein [Bacteroidota bacterium]